ncbi:MAG: hypothetical protein WAJ94_07285 [Candidatus Cybelea sp.]
MLPLSDAMPVFWRLWASTEGQPAKRVRAFKEEIVMPNLAVYADGEFGHDLLDDATIGAYLERLEPIVPQMRTVSRRLAQQLPPIIDAFQKSLPDFKTDNIVIYMLPSFFHFNAQTHDIGKKIGLLLGIDGIVRFDGVDANVGVDVSHELFHLYQFQMQPNLNRNTTKLWQAVWVEGSATYASQVLTPGATEAEALMSPALSNTDPTTVSALACAISAKWDSQEGGDMELFLDGGKHPANLPPRGGYLIGYLVASDLGKTYSLAQTGKLTGVELEGLIRPRVQALCKTS